jgi:asparagine synthase (glutamine-hydrolysing)
MFGTYASALDVAHRLDRLRHRGPDGAGIVEAGDAVHGHVRLALVDLTDASAQPFRHGEAVLTFVGEIWNFREVRAQLQALGRTFRTTGDTVVLALALDEWDIEALPRLEGMFTAAWSKGDRHLLIRDRFGKVPLYVHRHGSAFVWSSERKALGPELPARPLPPASCLDLTTGALSYWYTLPERVTETAPIAELLEAGVAARLVADAPLCCLVSGGLDSSLVLTLARRHKPDLVAFTAKHDESSADLAAARRLCTELEVPLIEVPVPAPSADLLTAAARAIEIPSKAQIEIAALCIPLAREIAANGFKACLSGEAADELFGGYGSLCIKGRKASDRQWRALRTAQLEKMARGNFIRCNKAFMAAGVECRLPFMERRLVERTLAMTKAECPPGKGALKAAARGIVPEWVIRRTKQTFQGSSGIAEAAGRAIANPRAFYRAEIINAYGASAG